MAENIDLEAVKANARAFAESRAAIGEAQWLRDIEAFLTQEDEDSRYATVNEIMRYERPPFYVVGAWLQDARPLVRETACYIASWQDLHLPMQYPQAVPALLPTVEDSDAAVRSGGVTALAKHQLPACLSAILPLVADSSEDVRFSVAWGLGSFGEWYWEKHGERGKPATQAALLRLMDYEDENVRDWATFGIHQGSHDTPESRARLWKALNDPFSTVRGEAAAALAIFDERSFLPRLAQLLREDEACPTHYFEAAETFNDPVLLPAVLEAAEGWRRTLKEGQELRGAIVSAIEKLRETAAAALAPQTAGNESEGV